MNEETVSYFLCNHWTESGIGYAFQKGWYDQQWYAKSFSSVYTVEQTMEAADAYPWITPCLELDSYAYEQLAKHAANTLHKLQRYVAEGKVGIEGGTYGQPLGQDYGGESNIAHLVYGKQVIQELLHYDLKAFMVEEQWFHPQLPQLLKKSGFDYASLQCQNSGQVATPSQSLMNWQGVDGSTIVTIPANDCMISCVKQYGDYASIWDHLKTYEQPLLFQWAEVWVPGMDWGASYQPFEKAFLDIKEKGAVSLTLQQYIEQRLHQGSSSGLLDPIRIPYDDSNYGNDWYQSGGWGYDGDRILYETKECEAWIQAYEAKRFFDGAGEDTSRDAYWKRLMILQNHDVSVARGYRAVSEDGIHTDANSLFIRDLKQLKQDLRKQCGDPIQDQQITSYNGITGLKTYVFPIQDYHHVYMEDTQLPSSLQADGLHTVLPLNAFEKTKFRLVAAKAPVRQQSQAKSITLGSIELSYLGGWTIQISEQSKGITVQYQAFSGSIGKRNEHDDHFHALSSAHHQFSFAFDGKAHCPDQCSSMYVQYQGIEEDDVYITMKLFCPLLTLHTTATPVAFASCEVKLNKITQELSFSSYLYCGVYLNMDAYSCFTYNMEGNVYRNYPFGEEETKLDAFYALDYVRVSDQEKGFVIMNFGNQRVFQKGKQLRFKISKGKMFGEYHFQFKLSFKAKDALDALTFVQKEQLCPLSVTQKLPIQWDAKELFCSSIQYLKGRRVLRLVNYSDDEVKTQIQLSLPVMRVVSCDFQMREQQELSITSSGNKTGADLICQPHEIITLVLYE